LPNARRERHAGADWIASWRLTRRQLETVARGELPAVWITWARRDLARLVDPSASFIARTSSRTKVREKL
jgi:hypothetical protein